LNTTSWRSQFGIFTIFFAASPQEKCKGAAAQKQMLWLCLYLLCMYLYAWVGDKIVSMSLQAIPVEGNIMHNVIALGNLRTMTCSCFPLGAFCSFEP